MANKLKGLTKKEISAIAEFEHLLLGKFPKRVKKLILFGSKARGDFGQASDLDILVVVSKNGKPLRREIVSLVHWPIVHFGVELSPIIVEEKEFKKWSPFISRVKKEGILLWKKGKKSL